MQGRLSCILPHSLCPQDNKHSSYSEASASWNSFHAWKWRQMSVNCSVCRLRPIGVTLTYPSSTAFPSYCTNQSVAGWRTERRTSTVVSSTAYVPRSRNVFFCELGSCFPLVLMFRVK